MSYWHDLYGYQNIDFVEGVIAGIEACTIWKDGEQHVGTLETPLREVVEEVRKNLLEGYKKSTGKGVEMTKPIQAEAWAAIRLDKDSGREWLDRNSISHDRERTVTNTGSTNHAIPYWAADNPVVRIIEVVVKEKMDDESKDAS